MGRGHRQERLGEEIKKIISGLILRELKDPRLSVMVSITAVEVTSDGSYATVYLSVLGNDLKNERAQHEGVVEALYGAKGLIRGEIGKKLNISRSYVSRIEKRALTKLREGFEKMEVHYL